MTSHFIRSILVVSLAMAFALAMGSAAAGGIDSFLQNDFNSLGSGINITNPSLYSNQTRAVANLGQIAIRSPDVPIDLIHVTPPTLRLGQGCGGLDMIGGSISIINKNQIETIMRSIASDAQTYFFTLALTALCPTCADQLNKLNSLLQELNKHNYDSCTAAQAIVKTAMSDTHLDAGLKDVHDDLVSAGGSLLTEMGIQSDDVTHAATSLTDAASTVGTALATNVFNANNLIGNVTWRVILHSDNGQTMATAFGMGNDFDFDRMLLSLVGSKFVSPSTDCANSGGSTTTTSTTSTTGTTTAPATTTATATTTTTAGGVSISTPTTPCTGTSLNTSQLQTTLQSPTIHIEDLMDGSGINADGSSKSILLYACPTGDLNAIISGPTGINNDCLTQTQVPYGGSFTGLVKSITLSLAGDPSSNTPGLLQKLAFIPQYKNAPLTPQDIALLQLAPQAEMASLIKVARQNNGEAMEMAGQMAQLIAAQIVRNFLRDFRAEYFANIAPMPDASKAINEKYVSDSFARLNKELDEYMVKNDGNMKLLEYSTVLANAH